MDKHEEAVAATARRLRRAQAATERAKEEHITAVLDALRAGRPPMRVAELSPFSDAHLRQLARDAGIPPAVKGRRAIAEAKVRDNASGGRRALPQRHRQDHASS